MRRIRSGRQTLLNDAKHRLTAQEYCFLDAIPTKNFFPFSEGFTLFLIDSPISYARVRQIHVQIV
jgi:hypothetical protein